MNSELNQSKEELAYILIYKRFNNTDDYDELCDALYHYMEAYLKGFNFDVSMFADEIENLADIRNHTDIINYILKYYS